MIGKLNLLANTIRYLKPIQLYYQLYYRLKPKKSLDSYKQHANTINVKNLVFLGSSFPRCAVNEEKRFEFLNCEKIFKDQIDWNFLGYGKLWNYNLQYFNFLNNEELTSSTKIILLKDIGSWLSDGRLPLEPYPVSLRIINSIRFSSRENIINHELISDIYAQSDYLIEHLEYHILGNHLLENAFALLMSGHYFKKIQWQNKAIQILYKELDEQILDDGCHFELSPMYHQIILFRVLELIDWFTLVEGDPNFLKFLRIKGEKMCAFLASITFENGDIPHFSDSSDSIALRSSQLLEYARLLNLKLTSAVKLSDSGYRVFNSKKYECVVDVGRVGPSYQPGHSHADALSFVLYSNMLPVVVDSGTSTYQLGEKRNYERSTEAHNTVLINKSNQSQVWGGFRVGARAVVDVQIDNEKELVAVHDGYKSRYGVTHQRSFQFSEENIKIKDSINKGYGTALFHFHPNCKLSIAGSKVLIERTQIMFSFSGDLAIKLETCEIANGFNKYEVGTKLIVEFRNHLETEIRM